VFGARQVDLNRIRQWCVRGGHAACICLTPGRAICRLVDTCIHVINITPSCMTHVTGTDTTCYIDAWTQPHCVPAIGGVFMYLVTCRRHTDRRTDRNTLDGDVICSIRHVQTASTISYQSRWSDNARASTTRHHWTLTALAWPGVIMDSLIAAICTQLYSN